ASRSFRSRISSDRLAPKSDRSWSINSSLTYLLIVQSNPIGLPSGLDPDARAHGGRDGDGADVSPLGGGRLDGPQVVQEGVDVLDELVFGEAQLADGGRDVAPLVVAELDLARLEFPDGGGDVGR